MGGCVIAQRCVKYQNQVIVTHFSHLIALFQHQIYTYLGLRCVKSSVPFRPFHAK